MKLTQEFKSLISIAFDLDYKLTAHPGTAIYHPMLRASWSVHKNQICLTKNSISSRFRTENSLKQFLLRESKKEQKRISELMGQLESFTVPAISCKEDSPNDNNS